MNQALLIASVLPLIILVAKAPHPRYAITHAHGGETVRQVIKRTGAKEVLGGDYFGRHHKTKQVFAFDLVLIKGKTVIPYQGRRPVLVVSRFGKVRIEKPYRPKKDDYYAIAGSFVPADPNRRCSRQAIVLKSATKLKFVRFVGTYRSAKRRFKGQKFIFMDGGHAANPCVRVPTHVIRRW
jgi:hypothetical protein